MRSSDLDAMWVVLGEADPDVLERDAVVELQRGVAAVRAWCDALQVRTTRRLRALAEAGRAEQPADVLGREGRQSSKDARTADERERACTTMPGVEDALASGSVAAGHVDALARATRHLDEAARAEFAGFLDELLVDARRQGVDAFERNCRDVARRVSATKPGASPDDELAAQRARASVKHWHDRETGMWHTHLELDPVRDATLWNAVREGRRRVVNRLGSGARNWPQIEVDSVIEAIGGGGTTRVAEVTVVVDDRTRCHGVHADSLCETGDGRPLPAPTVQRWCCDAEIAIAHLDDRRELVALGRTERTASRAQRRALRTMHRTCAHPDCDVAFDDCRIHHIRPYRLGGTTDLPNMLPLCERHHHLVHEGRWTLTMGIGRIATWTRPDGIHHHTGPTIDRTPKDRTTAHRQPFADAV